MNALNLKTEYDVIVVGGGAGGMLCALQLKNRGKNVLLLERGERLGKKLSSTGNGQGNVTNVNFGVRHYFSDDLKKVDSVLNAFTADDLIAYLSSLGGLFSADEKGRVYPTGKQASALTDLFRFALARAGVQVELSAFVKKVEDQGTGYVVRTENGAYRAKNVVLATGGKAAKNFLTDGAGYEMAKGLSHSVTAVYPALVQLKTETEDVKTLKGIRVDAVLSAYDGEKLLKRERGDVIFTDYGISGNAVFFLSSYLTDKKSPSVSISFLPEFDKAEILSVVQAKSSFTQEEEIFGCILNNQVGRAVVKRLKREGKFTVQGAVELVKDFRLRVTGTLGFDYAQVTRGGVPMAEVTENLESKKHKGLYFVGEILNVDGECGGYNLQWAFSSATVVARAVR